MRLTKQQHEAIKQLAKEVAGENVIITLFGSRVDDSKKGGDVDLLLELPNAIENPAWLAAQLSAKVSRLMGGRSVDVLLSAPNLERLPIHVQAKSTGVKL